jgi:hypothetical protein
LTFVDKSVFDENKYCIIVDMKRFSKMLKLKNTLNPRKIN